MFIKITENEYNIIVKLYNQMFMMDHEFPETMLTHKLTHKEQIFLRTDTLSSEEKKELKYKGIKIERFFYKPL